MNKTLIYGGLCLTLSLLIVGCRGNQPFPETGSYAALLYTGRCGMCHQAFHPQSHTYTGWTKVVPRMEKRAEDVGIRPLLTEEEKPVILNYLKKYSSRGF